MPQEQPQRFWMVYVAGKGAPRIKHDTQVAARLEAQRLADLYRSTVYILEPVEFASPRGVTPSPMPEVTVEQFAEVHIAASHSRFATTGGGCNSPAFPLHFTRARGLATGT